MSAFKKITNYLLDDSRLMGIPRILAILQMVVAALVGVGIGHLISRCG